MAHYHISIVAKRRYHEETDRDEGIVRVISENYNAGREFLFDGRWISPVDIEEIHILATPGSSDEYDDVFFDMHKDDVTRLWIQKPPQAQDSKHKRHQVPGKNVFIVHGRDHEPMKELKTMLLEFGLSPIVLHQEASGGLTLAEKLEKYSKDVGYAFVILTPEDVGGHRGEMRQKLGGDIPFLSRPVTVFGGSIVDQVLDLFEPRARQNVIFEMGYFWGLLERKRVCCLLKGNVEKPSDIEGIVYVPFKDSVYDAQVRIMKELRDAEYEIKL